MAYFLLKCSNLGVNIYQLCMMLYDKGMVESCSVACESVRNLVKTIQIRMAKVSVI